MNTDRDYLAAGLALGGLSEAELAEAQTLADTDADFRSEVAEYEDTMALMAGSDAEASESSATGAPEPISAATRNAILAIPSTHVQEDADVEPQSLNQARSAQQQTQSSAPTPLNAPVQPAPQAGTHSSSDVPPPADLAEHRRKRRPWVPMAAAAAAVVVAAGVGVSSWQKQNELEDELAAAQQQLDDSARLMEAGDLKTSTAELPKGGSVTVLSSEKEQLIRFSPRDVTAAPAGKSMQMWVIGNEGPESVGLMTGQPVTIADEPFSSGSLFGITVEPEGGSKQPTTDPIVAIDL
ncbi:MULTISPECIES: anti-sigma factor [unclassified Brevibacterium]|uniref:anti-sigma factor n=1 Tax=unclassified Brevibacterium TaxID=2614124 RepID=UPI000C418D8B|nr:MULTISPECIES: anti-sigma factor [unclassified Brevibacterium]SMX86351.1 Anti-sigma-K factor rskA [Brevibacterium sp. 239c]